MPAPTAKRPTRKRSRSAAASAPTAKRPKRPTRKRSRSSASRRTSSRTQRDIDALLEQDPHEKRPTLKALALVGEGATKDVYRKGDIVYKYHVRRSNLTRFATPPDVLAKMLKLGLVIPEVRLNDALYSTEYCEPILTDEFTAVDIVRCNILLTQFADALAQHDIYGMDLHTGNLGRRASDGRVFIIDNEGFFRAETSKAKPHATMLCAVGATVNEFDLPHAQKVKWSDTFDASNGWYASVGGGESAWAKNALTYMAQLTKATTLADIRLRNFVCHYFQINQHMAYGLRLLRITKVYADATAEMRQATDTFLTRYYDNRGIPYATIGDQPMYASYRLGKTAWLLDKKRAPTYAADVDRLARVLVKQPFYAILREQLKKPTMTRKQRFWNRVKMAWKGTMAVGYISLILGILVWDLKERLHPSSYVLPAPPTPVVLV
jgi:hypothetical protein